MLPMTFSSWDRWGDGEGDIVFYGAVFTADFGPWKKNTFVQALFLSLSKGKIEEFDSEGINVVRSIDIRFAPKEENNNEFLDSALNEGDGTYKP